MKSESRKASEKQKEPQLNVRYGLVLAENGTTWRWNRGENKLVFSYEEVGQKLLS